jgi:histidinol dehydrogenase
MYRTKLLVVANQTVDSDELYDALKDRAEHGTLSVTLLIPQDAPAGSAHRVNAALERLHAGGIEAEAMLGDVDPACAVIEVWDPRRWDEILVSTLPTNTSRWLRIDLLNRIARAVDAPVHHLTPESAHHVTTR